MAKSNQKGRQERSRCALLVLAGLGVVCASLVWPVGNVAVADEGIGNDGPKARAREAAVQAATKAAAAGFECSLEMRENVDFLLTPALLVQEALSESKGAVRFDAILVACTSWRWFHWVVLAIICGLGFTYRCLHLLRPDHYYIISADSYFFHFMADQGRFAALAQGLEQTLMRQHANNFSAVHNREVLLRTCEQGLRGVQAKRAFHLRR